jgi:hypothetical protein
VLANLANDKKLPPHTMLKRITVPYKKISAEVIERARKGRVGVGVVE